MASLDVLAEEPQGGRLAQLRDNTERLVSAFAAIRGLRVCSDRRSPIVHIQLADSDETSDYAAAERTLSELARRVDEAGVFIPISKYMPSEIEHSKRNGRALRPSLRCTVSAIHTTAQVDAAAKALSDAARAAGVGAGWA